MSVLIIWKVLSDCESPFFLATAPAIERSQAPGGTSPKFSRLIQKENEAEDPTKERVSSSLEDGEGPLPPPYLSCHLQPS